MPREEVIWQGKEYKKRYNQSYRESRWRRFYRRWRPRRGGFRRKMYDAVCSGCGKAAKVPFRPIRGRPVYCRECYPKHRPTAFVKPVRMPSNLKTLLGNLVGLAFFSLILFGIFSSGVLITGNKFGLFSLPWVETIGVGNWDFSLYIGIALLIIGGIGIASLITSREGLVVFPIVVIVTCLIIGTVFPGAVQTILWRGASGESKEEFIKQWGFAITVGADGHRIWLHNNPAATNPSYSELLTFLSEDGTNLIQYSFSTFVCADFAERLHNNAEKAGIRSAYVTVNFSSTTQYFPSSPFGVSHALNAFNTTDHGLVFVDDSGGYDCVVDLAVGGQYVPVSLFSAVEFYSLGEVRSYQTQW